MLMTKSGYSSSLRRLVRFCFERSINFFRGAPRFPSFTDEDEEKADDVDDVEEVDEQDDEGDEDDEDDVDEAEMEDDDEENNDEGNEAEASRCCLSFLSAAEVNFRGEDSVIPRKDSR